MGRVIAHQEAEDRLVAACSGFEETWLQRRAEWGSEQGGHYNDLGALAVWLVDRMAARQLDCFDHLFDELEALLADPSAELRELLVVGFLEDIQNVASNHRVDPDIVLPFLGPEARKGWFELIRMWHGDAGAGWPGQTEDGSG